MSITVLDRMTYCVCIIHENSAPNTQAYPYKDCVLIYDKRSGVFRFPEQDGNPNEARDGFTEVSDELSYALATVPADRKATFTDIVNTPDGVQILLLTVKDSYHTTPAYLSMQTHNTIIRTIMDEIRQGRVCHSNIHSNVRNLFFSTKDSTHTLNIPPTSQYFYQPASDYIAKSFALIQAPTDTPDHILHSPGYYRIPMIGYHGTSEPFVQDILTKGLQSTKSNGMYGNDAFYFGSFFKAIRYSFRDSTYSEMLQKTSLYKKSRPFGYIEVPNTAHINTKTGDIHTDLIRDTPALVRFVLFITNPVFLPRNARALENVDSPKLLKSIPAKTVNTFLNYNKNANGIGKTIYSDEYLKSQIGVPLFKEPIDIPLDENDDLTVPSDSSREETTLRLYRAIHVATRPAFA